MDPSIERAQQAAAIVTPDVQHSEHVAVLSLQMFDQLEGPLGLRAAGRDILAAAALWHDAGQRFTLPDHHRRSFDIIQTQNLASFGDEERLVIANVARYHRQSLPSLEHTGYRNLRREQRPLVDQLAALLRIAEGLDASHMQLVQRVECEVQSGTAILLLFALTYPMLEAERGQARAGLFRDVFSLETDFEWRRGTIEGN